MKKLITLLILVMGFVGTANATTLHVGIEIKYYSGSVNIYRYTDDSTHDVWNSAPAATFDGLKYGRYWYSIDMGTYTNAVVKVSDGQSENITNISGDNYYAYMSGTKNNNDKYPVGQLTTDYDKWNNGLTCRNGIEANWSSTQSNMICDVSNPNLFTYSFTPSQIGNSNEIIFRFKQNDYVPLNTSGASLNGYPQIYPSSDGTDNKTDIVFGTPITAYDNYVTEDIQRVWKVSVPSYPYDKIVISAEYVNDNGYKWKISADAILPAVTTNGYGYCTYVAPVALTIEGATAYYATDKNNGSAAAYKIANPAADTPLLIKGEASTSYSFKVAASGTDVSSTNAFKAGTGSALANQTDGKYNYILNGDAFYAANGQNVAVGKAYLQLSKQASARGALIFDNEEETGINVVTASAENVDAYYNLKGQRITSPSKGLYIVNGRKVIMK